MLIALIFCQFLNCININGIKELAKLRSHACSINEIQEQKLIYDLKTLFEDENFQTLM